MLVMEGCRFSKHLKGLRISGDAQVTQMPIEGHIVLRDSHTRV